MATDLLNGRDDAVRRRELPAFLRTRRERLQPEDVGLPSVGRRRVKGLRREEVAIVAGLGLTWYTLLETGADINVSRKSIDRIGDALRLSGAEREVLAQLSDPGPGLLEEVADDTLRRCVDNVRSPAFVLSATWDVLYWNSAFAAAWLIELPGSPPFNAVEYQFIHALDRGLQGDRWAPTSQRMAAQFRADYLAHAGEARFDALVARLRDIPSFREMYDHGDVILSLTDVPNAIDHPTLGHIDYTAYNLSVPGTALTLTVQIVSDATADALASGGRSDDATP